MSRQVPMGASAGLGTLLRATNLSIAISYCALPDAERIIARFAPDIHSPCYYPSSFSSA